MLRDVLIAIDGNGVIHTVARPGEDGYERALRMGFGKTPQLRGQKEKISRRQQNTRARLRRIQAIGEAANHLFCIGER